MNEQDLVNHLYDELSFQHELYLWTAGTLITIIIFVVGFYTVQQWRFSDKGIERMQKKFKKNFKINELNNGIRESKIVSRNAKRDTKEMQRVIKDTANFLLKEIHNNNDSQSKEFNRRIKQMDESIKKSEESISQVNDLMNNGFNTVMNYVNEKQKDQDYNFNKKISEIKENLKSK